MKLLVGMLSHGENERERAISALKAQSFRNWDFFEIANQPNKQAHQALYKTFMESGADCYLKLDADMVLQEDVLGLLVEETKTHNVTMVGVDDWPSLLHIPGMQIFSNRCRWVEDGDPLNVDTRPVDSSGRHIVNKRWVVHMPDPHDFQSFRYGVHKALKILQRGRPEKNVKKAAIHHQILDGIWKHRGKDKRRGLMILGAECVFSGQHMELFGDYAGEASMRVFNEVKGEDASRFAGLWDDAGFSRGRVLGLMEKF